MKNSPQDPHLVVYGHPHTRVGRVVWLLEELDLPHIIESIDFFDDRYDDKNAGNRRVPFLIDHKTDSRIFESLAINTWLLQTYGSQSSLSPQSSQEWADTLKWSFWAMTELDPLLFEGLMYNDGVGHILSSETYYAGYFDRKRTTERRDRITRELEFPLSVLDSALKKGGGWLTGERFTGADLNVASVAFWVVFQAGNSQLGDPAERFPDFSIWLNQCMDREHSPLKRILRDRASDAPGAQIDWARARQAADERVRRGGALSDPGAVLANRSVSE